MHRFLLHNDDIRETDQNLVSPGQVGLLNGWGVFSTLRVSNGVLFAYERHFARMRRDAELMRVPFPADPSWLETLLLRLVEANAARNATVRVVVVRNRGGPFEGPGITRDFDLIAFSTDLKHWGPGVKLALAPHGRYAASRYAGTKILSWSQNLAWNEEAVSRGFDEVILLNERDEVSECTSANVFVIQGNNVWTPPLASSGCLPGITRELLLEEIHCPGITIAERVLLPADLEAADHVFVTSSTRDLLPVTLVEGLKVRQSGAVLETLQAAFLDYRERYVAARSSLACNKT